MHTANNYSCRRRLRRQRETKKVKPERPGHRSFSEIPNGADTTQTRPLHFALFAASLDLPSSVSCISDGIDKFNSARTRVRIVLTNQTREKKSRRHTEISKNVAPPVCTRPSLTSVGRDNPPGSFWAVGVVGGALQDCLLPEGHLGNTLVPPLIKTTQDNNRRIHKQAANNVVAVP